MVIGVPNPYCGKNVKGFVVPQPGHKIDSEQVIAFCRELLAGYKVPRFVESRKLAVAICRNPRAVRFEDACRVAENLRFAHSSGKGSHRVFKRKGERAQLNFQNRGGFVPAYQRPGNWPR